MNKNEYIEFIKSELNNSFKTVTISNEKFHGPHWHLELVIQNLKIIIFGDIGFQVDIIKDTKKYNLVHLDKNLLGKQKTSLKNIKAHTDSLKELIQNDRIEFEKYSFNQVCQDLELNNTMEWGIINSNGSRVKEFIEYTYQNENMPFSIHYSFLNLIIASMNDSILENTSNESLETQFFKYVLPKLGDKKYYPYVTYWISISSEDEFPVGHLLSKYLEMNQIDISNW